MMSTMTSTLPHEREDDRRDRQGIESSTRALAGAVLGAHLADLPKYIPGEPAGFATLLAAESAHDFLQTMEALYGVHEWTRDEFRRAIIEGAIGGLRPDAVVKETPGGITLTSATCPIHVIAANDARACRACRAFMEGVAREALRTGIEEVGFPLLIARGDEVCETSIRLSGRAPTSSAGSTGGA